MKLKIPRSVAEKIGYYVYAYFDPRTDKPFYIGKGFKGRVIAHFKDASISKKTKVLNELESLGIEPRIEILAHALATEKEAFLVERAAIDLIGLPQLTNKVLGHGSSSRGRVPLKELVLLYEAPPVKVTHPSLLIRVNQLYSRGMSQEQLYEITRGVWRLSRTRAENVKYAMAVFCGVVREVFEVQSWAKAGSTEYKTVSRKSVKRKGRIEFIGRVAPAHIRRKYLDRSVEKYLSKGAQNPVTYVLC